MSTWISATTTAITGNAFSSSNIGDKLQARIGDVLLFPIYRKITGTGTGAQYEIVGWAAFKLTGMDLHGNNEKLFGEFVGVTWDGIQAEACKRRRRGFRRDERLARGLAKSISN